MVKFSWVPQNKQPVCNISAASSGFRVASAARLFARRFDADTRILSRLFALHLLFFALTFSWLAAVHLAFALCRASFAFSGFSARHLAKDALISARDCSGSAVLTLRAYSRLLSRAFSTFAARHLFWIALTLSGLAAAHFLPVSRAFSALAAYHCLLLSLAFSRFSTCHFFSISRYFSVLASRHLRCLSRHRSRLASRHLRLFSRAFSGSLYAMCLPNRIALPAR